MSLAAVLYGMGLLKAKNIFLKEEMTFIAVTEKGEQTMSRDKHIEEMAKEICSEYDCVIPCQSCGYYGYANCRDVKSAEKLYIAGYRKASDVAREIFEEIQKLIVRRMIADVALIDDRLITDIAKLRKKHLGEDINAPTKESESEG